MREILAMLPEFTACSGGGAANAAKIAGLLGIGAGFIGVAGAGKGGPDHFGGLFREDLLKAGVLPLLRLADKPTGIFLLIEMAGGTQRVAAAPSAALELRAEDVGAEELRNARVAVVDGYILERRDLVRHILDLADRFGTVTALDLGSPELAESRAPDVAAYIREYQIILFMNEDEAKAFYRALKGVPPGEDKKEEAPEEGLSRSMTGFFKGLTAEGFFPIIAVKLGKRGSLVFAGGGIYRAGTLPALPLEGTGAGDAYCGAFLAAWLRDKPLGFCADFGNRVAREVLNVPGTKVDRERLRQFAKMLDRGPTKAAPP
jgi:sugar/nucleoside kinase (ribokinase family)